MNSIPIAIELVSRNGYGSFFTFKVHNLDKTNVLVEGGLDKIQKYYLEIKEIRDLPNIAPSLIFAAKEIELEIERNTAFLDEQREFLPVLEKMHQKRLEQLKSENPILDYDKRLSETMTSGQKKGGLIACIVVTILGVLFFFSGYGNFRKFLGGTLFLGGGLVAAMVYSIEENNTSEAYESREIKSSNEKAEALITQTQSELREEMVNQRTKIRTLELEGVNFKMELEEAEKLIELAGIIRELNKSLGEGIIFGDEHLIKDLEAYVSTRTVDEPGQYGGLAGALAVGLIIAGAFAGLNF